MPRQQQQPHQFRAAEPKRVFFDPWNSASTGHQRPDNTVQNSTAWRDSRTYKLSNQFGSGNGGGERRVDTVVGTKRHSDDWRLHGHINDTNDLREQGQLSLRECIDAKVSKPTSTLLSETKDSKTSTLTSNPAKSQPAKSQPAKSQPAKLQKKQIFANLNFYINGSTYPTISDHKLRHLIAEHGGRMSIALGRKTVTHVILGRPNAGPGSGAGGGLAHGKIAKEVQNVRGKGVKFVSVEWVIESISAGARLPERRFECLRLAHKGQRSVGEMVDGSDGKG